MCGLFGCIGKGNPAILKALALANRERGTDSLGFFTSDGKIRKSAGDPIDILPSLHGYLARACRNSWFVAGHTRAATRGKCIDQNAHPFRFGNIIGAHNGIVSAPEEYAVDSMYLFDLLDSHKGDYQTALAGVSGYWALTWFDGARFYMQAHNNEIAFARNGRAWYYSSDWTHLDAVAKFDDMAILSEGETIAFSEGCADYVSLAPLVVDTRTNWERWKQALREEETLAERMQREWEDSLADEEREGGEWRSNWDTYASFDSRID